MKTRELEKLWIEYINRDEYNTDTPASEEIKAAAQAVDDAIVKRFGDEGRKFLIAHDSDVCEYGSLREKEGFFSGFKLAMRLTMECIAGGNGHE